MAYTSLAVTAPTLSAYDPDNPTQATEELNLALHNILQDMDDASGTWYLTDNAPSNAESVAIRTSVNACYEVVFNYAESAIASFRVPETIVLAKPAYNDLPAIPSGAYFPILQLMHRVHAQCLKGMWFIYYMWKTEEDPLRIKDYIRDMLMAWPLQDIAIDLNDETGTQLKVYPQWKNLET